MPSFPKEILRPRKSKCLLMLLGTVLFVAAGFFILSRPENSSEDRFWAYACIVFFSLCGVVFLVQLLPNSSFLRLTPEGVTVRSLWRTTFYRWSDIERFGVAEFTITTGLISRPNRLVGMDFSASYPHKDKAQALKSINRNLTGFEGALPNNYGWDHAKLAEHLNQLKVQYAGASASPREN